MTEHARDDEPNLREERATPPRRIRHRIAYTRTCFEGNQKKKSSEESQPRTSSSSSSSSASSSSSSLCSRRKEDNFVSIVEPPSSSSSISSSFFSSSTSFWSIHSGDIKEDKLKMSETTPVSFVVGEPDPDADEELEFGDSFPIEGNDVNNPQTQQLSVPPGLVERRKRLR
ncbi:hypothetical protein M0804_012716 [Polistes exclamans]|nr:hypothetical protein M0804_012716 [Polistes exclamans]